MQRRYKLAGGIGLGLATLVTAGITYLQGLEFWTEPEPPAPCRNMMVRVGNAPVSCPHPEQIERVVWDEHRSTAHLLCECYSPPDI